MNAPNVEVGWCRLPEIVSYRADCRCDGWSRASDTVEATSIERGLWESRLRLGEYGQLIRLTPPHVYPLSDA